MQLTNIGRYIRNTFIYELNIESSYSKIVLKSVRLLFILRYSRLYT